MKVKEYNPKYDLIESFKSKADGRLINFNCLMKWEDFKKKFGDCYLYSVRVYNDTKSVSICYGDETPIDDTYFSYTIPDKKGKGYLIMEGKDNDYKGE